MDIGITTFAGAYGMEPPAIGRAIEERGFESLFFPEHTHIPVHSRRSDGSSPRPYAETYDPFVALSAVAAVTRSLKLGTGVCLVTQRDPIVTAKQVACLDRLSGGRLLFGVGAGWNRMELANHGTDPRTRMALLAERVQAMRRIWTDEEAEFHGKYVNFDSIWSWPKPLQRPHPPVLVGGNGPGAEDRVLAFGDGWFPQCEGLADAVELSERAVTLRRRAADTGRGRIPITVFNTPPDRRLLDTLANAGLDRCLLLLPAGTESQMLAQLDAWAPLASMWRQVT
ncbi:LLM class F420-dependent oxidoreductase [Nonomuraea sp. NPDC003709]|uniref:LLM class F420-dependent oxidoreductase n=1 Tax=Nonomuraea sp. NPDC003709 TaxID=3154450 RepID=UPI0033A05E1B